MVITRLAPSPTGSLHIGTARTALFNFLWAKKQDGKFLLRIEDTDKTRSHQKYIDDIVAGLKWLGLQWDGEIIYQSKQLEKYQDVARQLVDKGAAYEKDKAVWFKIKDERLKIKNVEFDDAVRGKISFALKDLKDFVILRRDGIPTFHLASVVDDEEMQITDVIRGEDHLSNTPLHILIQKSLGYRTPRYAHLPLILNTDRSKMSKRTNPTSITADYRDKGYLPEAMINFLALLGWNPKDEQEFFTLDELVQKFDLSGIQKANAVFDIERLNWFNQHYLRKIPDKEIVEYLKTRFAIRHPELTLLRHPELTLLRHPELTLLRHPELTLLRHPELDSGSSPSHSEQAGFRNKFGMTQRNGIPDIDLPVYVAAFKDRAKTLDDFLTLGNFIFNLPDYPKELLIFKKSSQDKTRQGLTAAKSAFSSLPDSDWIQNKLQDTLSGVVKNQNLSNGDVFWPMRVALSGLDKSPSPAELLAILGKKESLRRLQIAIDKLS